MTGTVKMSLSTLHRIAWTIAVLLWMAPLNAAEPLAALIDAAKTGSQSQRVKAIHQLGAEGRKDADLPPKRCLPRF